jgi:hypothetical protein
MNGDHKYYHVGALVDSIIRPLLNDYRNNSFKLLILIGIAASDRLPIDYIEYLQQQSVTIEFR